MQRKSIYLMLALSLIVFTSFVSASTPYDNCDVYGNCNPIPSPINNNTLNVSHVVFADTAQNHV